MGNSSCPSVLHLHGRCPSSWVCKCFRQSRLFSSIHNVFWYEPLCIAQYMSYNREFFETKCEVISCIRLCLLLCVMQTKKIVGSSVPYISLGLLYAYLLYLSWTPDTIRLMFASKYWLPEVCFCQILQWNFQEKH